MRENEDPLYDVVVLGAGLAGSVAAYLLQRSGCRVVLVEARSRVGGRIATLYDWDERQYAELGPEFIDSNHWRVLGYAQQFGIPVRRRTRFWGLSPLPRGGRMASSAWNRFWEAVGREAKRLSSKPRPLTLLLRRLKAFALMDQLSMRDFAEQLGVWESAAPQLVRYCRNLEAAEPHEVSILSVIAQEAFYGDGVEQGAYRLEGGTQRLVESLVSAFEQTGGMLMLNTVAEAVQRGRRGVRLYAHTDGRAMCLDARYAVIALPFPMVPQLEFRPSLRPERLDALARIGRGHVVKNLLQFRTRFWLHQQPQRDRAARLPITPDISAIWDETDILPGEAGILSLWVGGEPASRWARFSEAERLELCLQVLDALYPNCRAQFIRGVSMHWSQEPFSQVGYPFQPPGLLTGGFRELLKPEGRLFFAGDYLSLFVGYMEGALESGERAACAILKRLGRYNQERRGVAQHG